MANNFSDWANTDILNTYLVNPTGLTLALFLSDPGKSDTFAGEVSGGGYARKAITFSAPVANGSAKRTANAADVVFPQATADWGVVTNYAVINAAGHNVVSGPLTASKDILNTDIFEILAGQLTVDCD